MLQAMDTELYSVKCTSLVHVLATWSAIHIPVPQNITLHNYPLPKIYKPCANVLSSHAYLLCQMNEC